MRARSSTGWTGGAATYDNGLKAHTYTRPAPGCSAPLSWKEEISHPVPYPVSTSKPHSGALRHGLTSTAVNAPAVGLREYHARYDGFGNLTSKSPTAAGPSTSMAVSVDPTANHLTTYGFSYDANGNMTSYPVTSGTQSLTYDIENRTGGQGNWYDLENQPLNRDGMWNQYGLHGERLASYAISLVAAIQQIDGIDYSYYSGVVTQTLRNIWFGNRLIQSNGQTVVLDRQGSVRANEAGETFEYFPYGEEITPTANGREKFATYTRESATGLDYANQRYYSSVYGRFTSSDPDHQTATAPADPNTPGSWNRYAYAGGDPINHVDPTGNDVITDLFDCFSEIAEAAFAGPAPCANPSLFSVSSFCGGASDQFNPLAAMACLQTIQFQSPDNQHVLQPLPVFYLNVGYTPTVNLGSNRNSYGHLFIWLQAGSTSNGVVFDGGPTQTCSATLQCGGTTAWESPLGHYNELTNPAAVEFFTLQLTGSNALSVVNALGSDTALLGQAAATHPYNPFTGPTSNSLLYSELKSTGVGVPIFGSGSV